MLAGTPRTVFDRGLAFVDIGNVLVAAQQSSLRSFRTRRLMVVMEIPPNADLSTPGALTC